MHQLLMVVLVCALPLQPDACTRDTALDVVTRKVSTPYGCMLGGQGVAAEAGLVGSSGTYIKVDCERGRD